MKKESMARHREKKHSIGIVIKEVLMLDLKDEDFYCYYKHV